MPEAPAAPVAAPTAPSAPAAPSPSAPAGPGPAAPTSAPSRTYSEQEYQSLEQNSREMERQLRNAEMFFNTDAEVKKRLELYVKSFQDGTPYEKLVADLNKGNVPTQKQAEAAGLTEAQVRQMVQDLQAPALNGISSTLSDLQAQQSAQKIMEANDWVTPEVMTEFDKRLNDAVQKRAQQEMQNNWPRLNPKQAEQRAWQAFAGIDDNMLFNILMQDKRDEAILSGKRPTPKLPAGMLNDVTTGTSPELLTQVRKALSSAEGNGERIAQIIKEFAPQLGVDPNDGDAVMKLYKSLNKVRP